MVPLGIGVSQILKTSLNFSVARPTPHPTTTLEFWPCSRFALWFAFRLFWTRPYQYLVNLIVKTKFREFSQNLEVTVDARLVHSAEIQFWFVQVRTFERVEIDRVRKPVLPVSVSRVDDSDDASDLIFAAFHQVDPHDRQRSRAFEVFAPKKRLKNKE